MGFGRRPGKHSGVVREDRAGRRIHQTIPQSLRRQIGIRRRQGETERGAFIHDPIHQHRHLRWKIHFGNRHRNPLQVLPRRSARVADPNGEAVHARSLKFGGCPSQKAGRRIDERSRRSIRAQAEGEALPSVGIRGANHHVQQTAFRHRLISNWRQHRRQVASGDGIARPRRGCVEFQHRSRVAVRIASLGHVVALRSKRHAVHQLAVGIKETDLLAVQTQTEAGVNVTIGRRILGRLAIGPHQQEAARRNRHPGRKAELIPIHQRIGEVISRQIHRRGTRVVEFNPIFEIVVRRIGQRGGVAGHEFIDRHLNLRDGGIIGRARGNKLELSPLPGFTIRIRSLAAVGREQTVLQVVHHRRDLRRPLAPDQADESIRGAQAKIGMQRTDPGLLRLTVRPHPEERARFEHRTGRKSPLSEVRRLVREEVSAQVQAVGAAIVQFDEGFALTGIVHGTGHVDGQNFVDPQQRKRIERRAHRIGRSRSDPVGRGRGGRGPITHPPSVASRIHHLQGGPQARRVGRPGRPMAVAHIRQYDLIGSPRGIGPDERQSLTVIVEIAREDSEQAHPRTVRRSKAGRIPGQHQITAGRNHCAIRERVADPVQSVSRHVEGRGQRGVVQFNERGRRSQRIILDFVDDHEVFRLGQRAGGDDLQRVRDPRNGLSKPIHSGHHQDIGGRRQRHRHLPTGEIRPRDWIDQAVHGQRGERQRCRPGQSNGRTSRGEVVAAIGKNIQRVHIGRRQGVENSLATHGEIALRAFVGSAGHPILAKHFSPGIRLLGHAFRPQRSVDRIQIRLPQPPPNRRRIEHHIDDRIAGTPQPVSRSIATAVQCEIHVPGKQLPGEPITLVGVHVLAPAHSVGVPVPHNSLEGERAHPLVNVHRAKDAVNIGRTGGVHRLDQLQQIRQIIRRLFHCAFSPAPAIAGRLQRSVERVGRRRESLQGRVHIAETGAVVLKLEPVLDLVEIRPVTLGKEALGVFPIGFLGILHHLPE